MQRIAKKVGYSETAFVAPSSGAAREVRYFSPEIEVPFCGHATIATGVAKAYADLITVSCYDGGTGASPLTSVKYAGSPFEL